MSECSGRRASGCEGPADQRARPFRRPLRCGSAIACRAHHFPPTASQRSSNAQPAQPRFGRADEEIELPSARGRLVWRSGGRMAAAAAGPATAAAEWQSESAPITLVQSTRSTICSCDRICPHSPAGHATCPMQRRTVCAAAVSPQLPFPSAAATSSAALCFSSPSLHFSSCSIAVQCSSAAGRGSASIRPLHAS